MKIIIAGGGTAGSVIPLVAVADQLQKQQPETRVLFIGTRKGDPEKKIISGYDFTYSGIFGGKIRRYFNLKNFSDIFLTLMGFFQSLAIITKYQPDIILGAGGFISVPVIWAGWVLRKKIFIHQQDIRPSFSNILTSRCATRITVAFEKSLGLFPLGKTVWTGNPVRKNFLQGDKRKAVSVFTLDPKIPIVLVMGGGTGARHLNSIINQALPELITFCQIIHLTGYGKKVAGIASPRYQQYEFLTDDLKDLLAAADLVVSRAGLSALTELSILGKPTIIVPLPDSHQEDNARYFSEKKAAIVLEEGNISPTIIANKIKNILNDAGALSLLSETIRKMIKNDAAQAIISELDTIIK